VAQEEDNAMFLIKPGQAIRAAHMAIEVLSLLEQFNDRREVAQGQPAKGTLPGILKPVTGDLKLIVPSQPGQAGPDKFYRFYFDGVHDDDLNSSQIGPQYRSGINDILGQRRLLITQAKG
jgi:hypothetical protein